MSLTTGGIIVQALARVQEITKKTPAANKTVALRRIAIRQQELVAMSAEESHEYYGVSAIAPLDVNGVADLATITDPIPTPQEITQVRVQDAGTSETVAAGDVVAIVPIADPYASIPPRVTIRNRLITQVGTDLDGVTSIRVDYVFRPPMYCPTDDCEVVILRSPYDELLIIDLAKQILRKSANVEKTIRDERLDFWTQEEAELLTQYRRHVREYGETGSRFSRPPQGVARPA
jgi:hypothetical protein